MHKAQFSQEGGGRVRGRSAGEDGVVWPVSGDAAEEVGGGMGGAGAGREVAGEGTGKWTALAGLCEGRGPGGGVGVGGTWAWEHADGNRDGWADG